MAEPFRTFLQGNLKAFTGVSTHTVDLVDELVLAICEHHTALEHLCLQQQFNAWSVIASSLLQQPHAQSLRAFPVSVLTACQSLRQAWLSHCACAVISIHIPQTLQHCG